MEKNKFFTHPLVITLCALLCCALWGSATPFIKIGYALIMPHGGVPSTLVFAGVRFFFAGVLTVLIYSIGRKRFLYPKKENLGRVGIVSCFQTIIQYIFFYIGLANTSGDFSYSSETADEDTVTVINALYRDGHGNICKLVFSGELILSDVPNLYARKTLSGDDEKGYPVYRDTYTELLPEDVANAMGISRSVNYYIPREMPIVIRRNTRCSPSLFGLSDCERIRPQQQAINKVESRILKKLLRSAVTPVMPEDATVTLGNSVFGEIIRTRPGESLDSYGKIDTTPDVSQDIAEADRLYDHAKRVLGISDALQGTDTTNAESGYARNLKIKRAESRLETKKRMKYHAYSALYRLIFLHYLAFSDEPRNLSYKDMGGISHSVCFDRFSFLEADGREPYYSDAYLFSVDLNTENDYTREASWDRNLKNLESGTLGEKSSAYTLLRYWQMQEMAHYPFARENVDYFKALINSQDENETKKE